MTEPAYNLSADDFGGTPELSLADARDHLNEVVDEAARGSVTYIMRGGRRMAAIVPADVAEQIERDEDEYLGRLASEALSEIAAGAPTIPLDQVKAELESDARDE
jgi:prevent-host-death family protein